MEDLLELTLAYDFYGDLLTTRQRRIFELYYHNDYSLQEIAENFGITKQAVSDQLSKCKEKLQHYEDRVGYMMFYERVEKIAEKINDDPMISDEIKKMLSKLLK